MRSQGWRVTPPLPSPAGGHLTCTLRWVPSRTPQGHGHLVEGQRPSTPGGFLFLAPVDGKDSVSEPQPR